MLLPLQYACQGKKSVLITFMTLCLLLGAGPMYVLKGQEEQVLAQCSTELKIVAADGTQDDTSQTDFRQRVSISGTNAIIGVYSDTPFGFESGAIYIFSEVEPGNWTQSAYIIASDGAFRDEFGYSVDIDGITAIVGAPHDDGGSSMDSGSVYIILETSPGEWAETEKIENFDSEGGGFFGVDVSISGTNGIVAATGADGTFQNTGAVYFIGEISPGDWDFICKVHASNQKMNANFGSAVDIGGDMSLTGAVAADAGAIVGTGAAG